MRVASTNLPIQWKSSAQTGLGRRLATALIFAVFLLQGFVAQTHMHSGSGALQTIAQVAGKALHRAPAVPVNPEDAARCPQCQAITHAVAYFSPFVLDLGVQHRQNDPLPIIAVRDMRSDYYGYSKQQRGPPSL